MHIFVEIRYMVLISKKIKNDKNFKTLVLIPSHLVSRLGSNWHEFMVDPGHFSKRNQQHEINFFLVFAKIRSFYLAPISTSQFLEKIHCRNFCGQEGWGSILSDLVSSSGVLWQAFTTCFKLESKILDSMLVRKKCSIEILIH